MSSAIEALHLLPDEEVVRRVLAGELALYEVVMRRHNQRLYRTARAILRDDAEAEDVIQETYVRAYEYLRQFAGEARFATWLTRIAVHEALARLKRRRKIEDRARPEEMRADTMDDFETSHPGPEQEALRAETRALLESVIDRLPDAYRAVFVLRDVEGMSVAETAACLDLSEDLVKVRLHRSRHRLRRELYARVGAVSSESFRFLGGRCDRVVRAVLARLREKGA